MNSYSDRMALLAQAEMSYRAERIAKGWAQKRRQRRLRGQHHADRHRVAHDVA